MRRAVEGRRGLPEPTAAGAAGELVNGESSSRKPLHTHRPQRFISASYPCNGRTLPQPIGTATPRCPKAD